MSLLLSRKRRRLTAARAAEPSVSSPLPAGWRRWPAARLQDLVRSRLGRPVNTKREAIAILEKELKHG